ncbi:hypothetical protein PR202_ga08137 [Eleusine coracana subsp. coracana]|uniref:Deoxyribodipyrimidine photo-lyase n=1 Tax=Eleusine coracana subsp. coracana TaxID=191504 RepID=A0AAV5C1F0_ELECO|nr:hypothetical protein PR202_ga08137 [Eleusine coracana subsp. coracana]
MAPTPANPTPASPIPTQVHPSRVRVLHPGGGRETAGPVVYWMLRDQRLADNWALLHAAVLAAAAVPPAPVAVAFSLFPRPFLLGARRRQLGFLLRGLRRLAADARARGLPFFFLEGGPTEVPALVRRLGAFALVTDFSPLRPVRESLDAVIGELRCDAPAVAVHQVDAHNVVPVWAASGKLEYSAKTLRGKVNKVIDEYLVEYPEMPTTAKWNMKHPEDVDWEALIDRVFSEAENVPEIDWCEPGEAAAMEALLGSKDGFLTKRMKSYESGRNDPTKPRALSCLSPYLHFGHISAQRCALEAKRRRHLSPKLEMVHHGKMHGFMRMYWAKKILEWTNGPEEALSVAIYLNDKYHIDGRDPNGYVGCMWSICGLHDQGWKARPVFGKIRYMNYAGCKRKFNVDAYISYVKRLVAQSKKRKAEEPPNSEAKQSKS